MYRATTRVRILNVQCRIVAASSIECIGVKWRSLGCVNRYRVASSHKRVVTGVLCIPAVIAPSRDDDSIADQCSGREREAHLFTQRGMVEVFTILSGFTHRIPTHLISDFGRRRRRRSARRGRRCSIRARVEHVRPNNNNACSLPRSLPRSLALRPPPPAPLAHPAPPPELQPRGLAPC